MNLKAHLPIIALCGLTFLVSFAAGLWWEIAQQDEWSTPEYTSSSKNAQSAVAKRQTDTEKTKSDQDGKSDTEEEKVTADEKDEPDTPAEDSESRPAEVTPEPGVAPNISPAAVPGKSMRVRGGTKRIDLSNMSEEQRAKVEEAMRNAREAAGRRGGTISTVEISSEPIMIDEAPTEGEVIIVEPDN